MHYCQIQHNFTCNENLCKTDKEYLNALIYKCIPFLNKFGNFWHITCLFTINHRKVINCQKQSIFGHPVQCSAITLLVGVETF